MTHEDATTRVNRRLAENVGYEARFAEHLKQLAECQARWDAEAPAREAEYRHRLATDPEFAALRADLIARGYIVEK